MLVFKEKHFCYVAMSRERQRELYEHRGSRPIQFEIALVDSCD